MRSVNKNSSIRIPRKHNKAAAIGQRAAQAPSHIDRECVFFTAKYACLS